MPGIRSVSWLSGTNRTSPAASFGRAGMIWRKPTGRTQATAPSVSGKRMIPARAPSAGWQAGGRRRKEPTETAKPSMFDCRREQPSRHGSGAAGWCEGQEGLLGRAGGAAVGLAEQNKRSGTRLAAQ
jgi:hypothetical protein